MVARVLEIWGNMVLPMTLMHTLYYKFHSQSEIFEILPDRTTLISYIVVTNSFSDRVIYMHESKV